MNTKQAITTPSKVKSKDKIIFAGLAYVTLGQLGPSHAPQFKVGVTVNGVQYEGVGG